MQAYKVSDNTPIMISEWLNKKPFTKRIKLKIQPKVF